MNESAGYPEVDVDPYAHETLLDPYPMHAALREAGGVVKLKPYPTVLACARHDPIVEVMRQHAVFISSAGVGLTNFNQETPFRPKSLILEADPPLHTQTRAVLARILSPKAVTQIRDAFTAEAEALIERCLENGTIDGIHDLAQPYPLTVFPVLHSSTAASLVWNWPRHSQVVVLCRSRISSSVPTHSPVSVKLRSKCFCTTIRHHDMVHGNQNLRAHCQWCLFIRFSPACLAAIQSPYAGSEAQIDPLQVPLLDSQKLVLLSEKFSMMPHRACIC